MSRWMVHAVWCLACVWGCADGEMHAQTPLDAQKLDALNDQTFGQSSEGSSAQALESATTAPHAFELGGQRAWFHDNGFSYGFFHTYDGLKVCGPQDAPRKVHVLLPRTYESRTQRYPVVYMQDGDTAFWPGGAASKSWGAAQTLSALQGQIEPVIVVAIHPLDREREYTHTSWGPGRAYGGAQAYTNYVADCVKGFIDTHYHTDAAASATTLLGSSHGGLLAFYGATRRPDTFGKAAALSPSFWAGVDNLATAWLLDERRRDPDALRRSALVRGAASVLSAETRPVLWMDWGLRRDGGAHNSVIEKLAASRAQDMAQLLVEDHGYVQGRSLYTYEDALGGHDEDAWGHRFGLALRALYKR